MVCAENRTRSTVLGGGVFGGRQLSTEGVVVRRTVGAEKPAD